ncbi:MAG: DUF3311 domain-containing protein [Rhodospirillales bacterium]|nr:DUF3311 domain-containing protein [Rhodospirillales bacterium]MDE2477810.1 DUF3311 domain-containing protein [Betaproteobacteria bacterium]
MHRWHWARVLLLIPFVAVLSIGFFDRAEPSLGGFPFFYWYQLLWILLSVGVIGAVYLLEHRDADRD